MSELHPGAVTTPPGEIELAPGRTRITIEVASTSDRPIRVSSHYPFWRVNGRLVFDRSSAEGFRLDVPAGSAVRFGPGEVRSVVLVAMEGGTQ